MVLRQFELVAIAPEGMVRLRELILTLAVRGRLVAQDPADEPASAILDQIGLVQSAQKPRGRRQEGAHHATRSADWNRDLPKGWIAVRNSGLFSLRKGRVPSGLSDAPPGIPYLDIDALDRGLIKRYTKDQNCPTCTVDDILVVCDGSRSGLVLQGKNGAVGSTLAVIEMPRPLQPYVKLIFREGFQRFNSGMKGAAIPHLDTKAIFAEVVGLPPLAEQARIVARVDELMRLCDALEAKGRLEAEQHARLLGTLLGTLTLSSTPEELAAHWQRVADNFDLLLDRPEAVDALEKTILQLAVRGLLVPQDPNDEPAEAFLGRIHAERQIRLPSQRKKPDLHRSSTESGPYELPSGWVWTTIENLAVVGTGTTPSRDNAAYFSDGTIPWVTSGETGQPFIKATSQHVTEAALANTSLTLYPVGTLIVAMYGQGKTRGQVSELCLEATTNQACAAIVLTERSASHRGFVKLVFEKSYDEIRDLSAGGAQPNLNVGKVKSSLIPLPPLEEQARIVVRVTELRRLCADLRHRLESSNATQTALADALIDQALVG